MLEPGSEENPDPPWEQPGAVRRDAAPHRGRFLRWLSVAGIWLSFIFCCFPIAGFLWNGVVLVQARRDLKAMAAGEMDPTGRFDTDIAVEHSKIGLLVAGLGLLGTVYIVIFLTKPAAW